MSALLDHVLIESVEITRAPGLPRGLKIERFGPGINVITGPNASGKSTTARLLHQLFSDSPAREDIEATVHFSYAGSHWTARRYGPHLTVFREGQPAEMPRFEAMSDDTRSRYLLSLHDLLRADDMAFARVVLKEAAGGYDLERATNEIRQPLPKTESDVTRAWDDARRMRDAARLKQEALAREDAGLQGLREQELEAIAARTRLELLREIDAALEAEDALGDASAQLAELPQILASYRGDEVARLDALDEEERSLHTKVESLNALIQREEAARQASGIDLGLATRELLDRLQGLAASLQHEQTECERAAISLSVANAREAELRAGIASAVRLDAPDDSARQLLAQLSDLAGRRQQAAAELASLNTLSKWVGDFNESGDLGQLQESIRLLRSWLQHPASASADPLNARLRWLLFAAAVVCIAEAIVLGITVQPALSLLALLGVAFGVGGFLLRPATADERERIVDEIEARDLPSPAQWDERSVLATLNELISIEQQELHSRAIAMRWGELPEDFERAQRNLATLDDSLIVLSEELGLANSLSPAVLGQIAEAIRIWRLAVDDVVSAEARLKAMDEQYAATLASFNHLSATFGFAEVGDARHATARLHDLQRREQEANRADQEVERAKHDLHRVVLPGLEAVERARAALLREVAAENTDSVRELERLWSRWGELSRARVECETTLRDRTRNLGEIDLAEWSQERVLGERAELERVAANQQTISQRIGAIVNEVNAARSGTTVDAALRTEERAATAVRERFKARTRQIIADRIADHVRRESEGSSLSPVARIARQRFAEFTQGRYQLQFSIVDGKPLFLAEDRTTGGNALPLDALSSATRVQLLIAVRAAFVESNEREAVLPLFFDETLANSDEARADAMVAATKALSARGRQIFYFTAQQDEVERWQELNPDHVQVDLVVADLASSETRRPVDLPLTIAVKEASVSPPNGHSRDEYRQLLGVGPLDRWAQGNGDIHLWFLEPDLQRLWSLLRHRIDTWGQLRTFVESKAHGVFGLSESEIAAIRARAAACEHLRELARVGRGRPVTALDLEQSGAFTDRYREEAVQLLDECEGDGGLFVQRLKLGTLKGLRQTAIDRVEDHFVGGGHLAFEAQLSETEIQHRALQHGASAIESGTLGLDDFSRLFGDLAVEHKAEPRSLQAIGE
jgi:uncharacterized protein YhaN